MTFRTALLPLLFAAVGRMVLAQEVGVLPADKALASEMDSSRSRVESSLKEYLVAFDSRIDSNRKRVGLPLLAVADDTLQLAYDPAGKNVMAQWKFAQTRALGQKLNYQAYVGESGTVNFVISTRY